MLNAANVTSNKIEVEVSKDWHRWCRLCANDDEENVNIFLKDTDQSTDQVELNLSDAIRKFFYVEITKDEEQKLPKQLCTQCFALVTSIVDYHKHVKKVQEMYIELHNSQVSTGENIQSLRLKLGIFSDYRPLNMVTNSLENAQRLFEVNHQVNEVKDKNLNVESDQIETMQQVSSFSEIVIKEEDKFTDVTLEVNENTCALQNEGLAEEDEDPFASDNEVNNEISEELGKISNENKKTLSKSTAQGADLCNKTDTKKVRAPEPKEYKFVCNGCPLKFRRIGSYRLHLHKKHGIPLPTLTCAQCSKIFKTEYDLKKHINIHRPVSEKNIFPCPQCDRKFQNKDYVATHIKFVHEDIRPFVCEECGEAVRTESALREHMLTHTDYAAFECDTCQKRFKNRARLKKHLETHSTNKHTCEKCGLQLNSRATLNLHKLVHSDEMPHKCDFCGRAFKRAKTLKSHLILHSGLKPYSCDFCDKTFANGPNCRTHKLKSHPEELAALEASGEKTYTKNIPKLSVLKTVTRTVENLTPVVSKNNGGQKRLMENSGQCIKAVTTVTIPPSIF